MQSPKLHISARADKAGPLLRVILVPLAVLLLPLGVTVHGYMPVDDVMRHAAYAVSHLSWPQVILGRPEALFDQSPGWHLLLRTLHRLTGCNQEALVTFSIVSLLMCILISGLPFVRRWESWIAALGIGFLVEMAFTIRCAEGRPFLLTSVAVLVLLAGVSSASGPRPWLSRRHLLWVGLAVVSTFCHGSWYLLAMAPGSLVLVGRWREGVRMGLLLAAGVMLGSLCTGHPMTFLGGELAHLWNSLVQSNDPRTLVSEFKPGHQKPWFLLIALAFGVASAWHRRSLRGFQEPLVVLALVTWCLGYFRVWRFYLDFSCPALALWLAWSLDDLLEGVPGRVVQVLAGVALLAAGILPNRHGRWSVDGAWGALDSRVPLQAQLLPDPGGILYSNSMMNFYKIFFRNPDGPWRYVLAYEPSMMLPEDRAVFNALQRGDHPIAALKNWSRRMTTRDRMLLEGADGPPPLPDMAWHRLGPERWLGRRVEGLTPDPNN